MSLLPLFLSIIAAFADIIGGSITLFKKLEERQMTFITAVGSGFLLGATLLDRLPDSMNGLPSSAPAYIIVGYLAMLVLERYGFAHSHHHGLEHLHTDASSELATAAENSLPGMVPLMNHKTGTIAFFGLLVHTFMDGVVIAGAFSINHATGVLMFLAITMHKLPEGFSMATISLASGNSQRKAFGTSIGLAISTILGASVTLWIGTIDAYIIKVIMALATGTFIFITTTSLIPAVKQSRDSKAILAVIFSVAIFYISLLLIKHVGLS
jgi:zinc transporter ZupT